jgi:two-component system response regulator LytT
MNILIIEDELKAARSLENIILEIKPQAKVIAKLQSIESSVKFLTENSQPDLIFMDIQLSDGLCFEIFKSVKIACPIVFCTAFDAYSLEAFKANGVDYVLKPFSRDDIDNAFKKVDELRNFFQKDPVVNLNELLAQLTPQAGKKSFLVFKSNKYITVPTSNIAYFYIHNELSTIKCFDLQEFTVNQSLDQINAQLSSEQFFRLNRQYIINFNAVKEVEPYFMRKLFVKLVIPTPETLLINKEKSPSFLSWLENR